MIYLSDYLKNKYSKAYKKIAIDGGFTCPNRDGSLGKGGCIFCSQKGSGDFTKEPGFSVSEQIELEKERLKKKDRLSEDEKFIAYFQAYTNTYASIERLRKIYIPIAKREDISIISIATRPDCLDDEVIDFLKELNTYKTVWIELGLQSIHESTAKYIRRGYDLSVYEDAVNRLSTAGIEQIITHVIIGLPFENKEMMLETVQYVSSLAKKVKREMSGNKCKIIPDFGVKLQLLHVLKGTDLEKDYNEGVFKCLEFEEYVDIVRCALKMLPEDMVVHRITGDGNSKELIAPLWSTNKKRVMNAIRRP